MEVMPMQSKRQNDIFGGGGATVVEGGGQCLNLKKKF